MSNWLEGKPDIKNDLMVVGKYDARNDDTLYCDVYNYPNLKYIGRFITSRFEGKKICESYPAPDNQGFRTVGEFRVWRELCPNTENDYQWLEVLRYGYPDLVAKPGDPLLSHTYVYSIVNGQPVPFEKLVNNIFDLRPEYYDKL